MKQTFVGGMFVGQLGFLDPKGNKKEGAQEARNLLSCHYIPTVDRKKEKKKEQLTVFLEPFQQPQDMLR